MSPRRWVRSRKDSSGIRMQSNLLNGHLIIDATTAGTPARNVQTEDVTTGHSSAILEIGDSNAGTIAASREVVTEGRRIVAVQDTGSIANGMVDDLNGERVAGSTDETVGDSTDAIEEALESDGRGIASRVDAMAAASIEVVEADSVGNDEKATASTGHEARGPSAVATGEVSGAGVTMVIASTGDATIRGSLRAEIAARGERAPMEIAMKGEETIDDLIAGTVAISASGVTIAASVSVMGSAHSVGDAMKATLNGVATIAVSQAPVTTGGRGSRVLVETSDLAAAA